MGRRKKRRIIRSSPQATFFKPQGVPLADLRGLALPLEGLEAMRLADGEGVPQEEAAAMMGVSRPTFNRILAEARKTVANALSQGMAIRIDGGDYELMDERSHCPGRGGGRGRGRRGPGPGMGREVFGDRNMYPEPSLGPRNAPEDAQTDDMEPDSRPADGYPKYGRPVDGQPGSGHPESGRPGDGHPGDGRPQRGQGRDGRGGGGRGGRGRGGGRGNEE